ncbi:hypothetical protein ABT025_18780 [Streptomyces sp. NPDC002809]|uniref:hypothetical protein n=1 Tax=Streptomyces sp. NPDC002809 TaxID=3154433 RepID=UPI00332C1F21
MSADQAAAQLRTTLIAAGILHDPAGMTDTEIQAATDAAHQLHTATNGDLGQLLDAINNT